MARKKTFEAECTACADVVTSGGKPCKCGNLKVDEAGHAFIIPHKAGPDDWRIEPKVVVREVQDGDSFERSSRSSRSRGTDVADSEPAPVEPSSEDSDVAGSGSV